MNPDRAEPVLPARIDASSACMDSVDPKILLAAGDFMLRRIVESDAPAFAAAARESAASVGKWMSWVDTDFSESQALDWFAMCKDGWLAKLARVTNAWRATGSA